LVTYFEIFKFFNHTRLWTEDHKIVHTCTTPHCLFTVIVRRRGGTAEIFWKIEKKLEFFILAHVKALIVFTSRGERSRSKLRLVGRSLPVLQPFYICGGHVPSTAWPAGQPWYTCWLHRTGLL